MTDMITYVDSLKGITVEMLEGFFHGWTSPPSLEKFYRMLDKSAYIVLAMDQNKVVGFVNAISDKEMAAYIPLVEVLPEYQKKGIGNELMHRMLEKLKTLYMVDTACDDNLCPFYEKFGMKRGNGMYLRNYSYPGE